MEKSPWALARGLSFPLILSLWLISIGISSFILLDYASKPAASESAPSYWPSESKLTLDLKLPTLIMAVHPHCPCTQASIHELDVLLTDFPKRMKVYVLFMRPEKFSKEWMQADIFHAASKIQGVILVDDLNGVETKRFHVRTSGETLLYTSNGRLIFQGGITPARGHRGNSQGRKAISNFLISGKISDAKASVFGCSLLN